MQRPKSSDTGLRYFVAISENKRRDMELRNTESKIDGMKKKMLTQYWKDKISVFDEMIRLNVKTPSYERDKTCCDPDRDSDTFMSLGPMNIDSKLMSNRPVTLQRGVKHGGRMDPVISVEGSHAVCYPNKEARKGRRVGLNTRVLRRMEQCKTLEENIAAIKDRDRTIDYNNPYGIRPKTAPGKLKTSTPRQKRSSPNANGRVSQDSDKTELSGDVDTIPEPPVSPITPRRPSTSYGAAKRDHYLATPTLTEFKESRPSTSFSLSKDRIRVT